MEIEREPQVKASEEVWTTALGIGRMPDSRRMKSIGYMESLRSHWLHHYAHQQSFLRWAKEDESERNREWLEGIFEAFQEGLAGEL